METDRTLYQVASVSKAVTAWGVMKLVEEGRLGLDEPVVRHLTRWRSPGSEAHRDNVTVRHLLSHTAGLDDGLGYRGFLPGETIQTLEESLTLTRDSTVGAPQAVRVAREPGTRMAYSGGGYAILQLLVEEVTKRPFADYMNETVLQPLGMTTASFDLDAIASGNRAPPRVGGDGAGESCQRQRDGRDGVGRTGRRESIAARLGLLGNGSGHIRVTTGAPVKAADAGVSDVCRWSHRARADESQEPPRPSWGDRGRLRAWPRLPRSRSTR